MASGEENTPVFDETASDLTPPTVDSEPPEDEGSNKSSNVSPGPRSLSRNTEFPEVSPGVSPGPRSRERRVAHVVDENPEDHIGEEVPDPWVADSEIKEN